MTPLIAPLLATLLRGTGHCVRYGRLAPCSVLRLHRRIRVESGCAIDRSDPVHCPVRQIECGTPAETDGSRIPPVNGSCSGGKPGLCTRSPEGGAARFNRNLWGGPVSRDTTFALYYIEKLGDAARCGVISFGRPSSSYRLFSFYRHLCRTYPSSALSSCPLPSHPYRPSFSRLFLLPALLCSRNARRKC